MRITRHPKSHLWGRQVEGLVILSGLAIIGAAGLHVATRLKQRGVGAGAALAGGLLAGVVIFTVLAVLVSVIAYVTDRRMRFRRGDRVRVDFGPKKGLTGVVEEPLDNGHRARVSLETGEQSETMDFQGWEIRKIKK